MCRERLSVEPNILHGHICIIYKDGDSYKTVAASTRARSSYKISVTKFCTSICMYVAVVKVGINKKLGASLSPHVSLFKFFDLYE